MASEQDLSMKLIMEEYCRQMSSSLDRYLMSIVESSPVRSMGEEARHSVTRRLGLPDRWKAIVKGAKGVGGGDF